MYNIAKLGEIRLQNVLLKDKQQNPKVILNMLKSDLKNLLENYMEIATLNADIEIENGFYKLKVEANARQIKTIGTLKD